MDEAYAGFIGDKINFADLVYQSKRQIMRLALASEVTVLTNMLNRISQSDRRYRDFTLNSLAQRHTRGDRLLPGLPHLHLAERSASISATRRVIETAVSRAKKRNPRATRRSSTSCATSCCSRDSENLSARDARRASTS